MASSGGLAVTSEIVLRKGSSLLLRSLGKRFRQGAFLGRNEPCSLAEIHDERVAAPSPRVKFSERPSSLSRPTICPGFISILFDRGDELFEAGSPKLVIPAGKIAPLNTLWRQVEHLAKPKASKKVERFR